MWTGQLISILGSQMHFWALLWHVRMLSDQPIALGVIGLVLVSAIVGSLVATRNVKPELESS